MPKITKLFIAFSVFFSVHLFSQNLLTNGDFETGGSGNGFTVPNYNLYTGTGGITPGNYAISNNPTPLNNFFIPNIIDHSPGAGNNMMIVDGSTNTNASFWSAGDNASGLCGLVIGSTYTFSYWVRTISSTTVDATTQPNIVPNFTNATGTLIFGDPTVGLPTETWQQVFYNFVPTATCVNINLVNINTSPGGNDFALDDLEVTLQLCPLTILSITNPDTVCEPNTVDITDPAVTAGSIGGGVLTYWEDATATVPLISPPPSAINVSGTYYIMSSSGPTCSDIKPVLVSIKPVIIPVFTPVAPICEGDVLDPLPTLSNNGVIGSWSPILDNTTTTTYLFTPDPNPNPNLVVNGDFSVGDSGFSTAYTNIPTSDGTSQGVYGIVTNSNLWFNSLSSCNDHTGGGNFMVADASVSNGGNDSVWCQTIPVQAGENYIFSFYALSVSSGSPANFEVTINGVPIGSNTLDNSTCNWMQSSFPWNSTTATTANICIYDRNTTSYGNDFGIDDISFVPTSIQCAETVDMTIVVTPSVTPTFDPVADVCEGDALVALPTTSLENITGSWLPALDNTTTTTYTFTPDAGQCTATPLTELTITVNPRVTPTFNPVAPICEGDVLTPLPTTSLENITGIWSPALDNTTTTTYTFTPNAGQCTATPLTELTITVNPRVTPTFDPVADICEGDVQVALPTTSLENITGIWSPALDNTTTTTYTFTPDAGQCTATPLTELTITVNPRVTPTFDPVADICEGDVLVALPKTSLENITGIWSPALDNTTTTTYTFTPDAGQCTGTPLTELTITVNPRVTPTFDPVVPICEGDVLTPLPTTSLENITGSWLPALDNTTTTTYTFTPNAGQCTATPLTELTITVNPSNVTPNFNQVDPVCLGQTITPLPTTSLENITGIWSPALDNTMTTTYTFTPNPGQCALSQTMTVTVNTPITPTFDPIAPICEGDALAPLPTTSLEGITGTWTPTLDNTITTLYTFEPDTGQCASNERLEIVVNRPLDPDFEELTPICEGGIAPVLQNTSPNGISGTWNPAVVDNRVSAIYIFTPNAGQCASTWELYMQINQPTLVNVNCEVGEPFSGNRTITVYASLDGFYEYQLDGGVPQYENIFQNVEPGTHTVTVSDVNGCSASITKEVIIIDYPKFFTPNGDGYNDYWNIIGLNQPDAKIYIFDRYGKLLKQISSESPGWDGTFNGEKLPSTDYWFTIDYVDIADNSKDQFKAHFSLKR